MKVSTLTAVAVAVFVLESCDDATGGSSEFAPSLEAQVELRINAAGADYTDSNGDLFVADKAYVAGDFGYVGGIVITHTAPVSGTADPTLYQSVRGAASSFSYVFDNIPAGDYDITLYFYDNNGVGDRLFDVEVEGIVELNDFDIIAQSGGSGIAHNETLTATVSDGQLNIEFIGVVGGGPGVFAISVIDNSTPPQQVSFTDVSVQAGVGSDQYTTATAHSLGVNWIDYNNDGWPDLFLVNGQGQSPHLYRNEGDGTFADVDSLLPVLPNVEMSGSRFADYDNDGDLDIYIFTDNPVFDLNGINPPDGPPNLLLKNLWTENGQTSVPGVPLFEEVAAAAGVDDLALPPFGALPAYRGKTGAWFDYDRDGFVDLYVAQMVMNIEGEPANIDHLYRNNGDGTFDDVTLATGLDPGGDASRYRPTLAFIAAHLDADLWPDMYVVNVTSGQVTSTHPDFIYQNNGGTFTDITASSPGVGDDAGAGMGIDIADIDHDGDWDIYISDLFDTGTDSLPLGNPFYLGNGDGTFQDNSAPSAGVVGAGSWGVSFFDVDQDTYEDLFVATCCGAQGQAFLYMNDGDGTFTDVAGAAGLLTGNGRGTATADYDRDGDIDLAQVNQNGTLQLFRNDTANAGNWLQVELESPTLNRDAIGTMLRVDIGGVELLRQVKGGSSGHSQDSLTMHFGLGQATEVDQLTVQWPSGVQDVLTAVAVNTFVTVVEGSTASPEPNISVGPSSLAFGIAGVGASVQRTVTITNGGGQTLSVSDLSTTNPLFTVTSPAGAFDVTPNGGTQDVTVQFAPTVAGVESGELEISSNDPDDPLVTVALTGEGVDSVAVEYRINAAGADYTDSNGDLFVADKAYVAGDFGYVGGIVITHTAPVSGTADPTLYQSVRGAASSFSYVFDNIPAGDYDITLYFYDNNGAGDRLFDVEVEGIVELNDFDIIAQSGGSGIAHNETLTATVSDGQLNIEFIGVVGGGPGVFAISVIDNSTPPQQVQISSPAPGSTLSGDTVTFGWVANSAPVTGWRLQVGTSVGDGGLHDSGTLGAGVLAATVSGLPTDGSTVNVRLSYTIASVTEFVDYTYTAFAFIGDPSITSPAPGSTLAGDTVTFNFNANGTGVTFWQLQLGTTPAGNDLADTDVLGAAVSLTTLSGLPADGSTIYARLLWITGQIGVAPLQTSEFTYVSGPPALDDKDPSVARQWSDVLLDGIRGDFARPTVHGRNLWHISSAMYDAWSIYDDTATTYLLGKTVGGFACAYTDNRLGTDVQLAREEAISYAAYRIIHHRFAGSPGAVSTLSEADALMATLGFDTSIVSADTSDGTPAKLGNRIAQCYIDFGLQDGSNEANEYANTVYAPVNPAIEPFDPGNPNIIDLNRWQPIALPIAIDQSGNPILSEPEFLSPEWGQVSAFALSPLDLTINQRNGFDYYVYHDPGAPPTIDGAYSDEYKWGFEMVAIWSSQLDPADGVMVDISPASFGNIDVTTYPTDYAQYDQFYKLYDGGDVGTGHSLNPITGLPYAPNIVPRGDYARVLAEFWADGPDSETPPGHWFTILNTVSDSPLLEKRVGGVGPVVGPLEWDVKAYFTLGGAMHDCAVTAWGIKGWYDYLRPVSALRAMADRGQSSDLAGLSYHPDGISLHPGFIELVESGDPLAGLLDENVGKIKLYAWRGPDYVEDPATDVGGVDWILAENWWPYQRPTFVTPPFAGFVSGHSTFSRAAAEVMTSFTGSPYFPGGIGEFVAPANEFLVFEDGPSVDIVLQWATYRDASEQTSLSRIWGGIHPPADDIPGRLMGIEIGVDAYDLAQTHFGP